MAIIHYDPESLISAGSQYDSYAEQVQAVFDQMKSVHESVEWEGPAKEKFVELYAEVSPQFEKIVMAVLSTGQLMKDMAAHAQESEEAAVSSMHVD